MDNSNPDNIKSSKKAAKMARKLVRKQANADARVEVEKFQTLLQEKLGIFNDVLRKRPRWIPRVVWNWASNIFIDVKTVEDKLNGK